MLKKKKCLLALKDDALIVANTGQPFSRLGVISICASHRGTKRRIQPSDQFEGVRDSDLPKAIREKEIETYFRDLNRLFDDYNQEIEVSFDYGGRFLWELLQNADDAMCPVNTPPSNLIGIKGLGFKSVLEITHKPTIYSDPFHFYFSANDNYKLLKERGINDPPPLTFRIPHDDPDIEDILDLVDEYPTIIKLPFKGQAAKKKVENGLIKLSSFFLLLSQNVETVELVWTNGRKRQWSIERENDGELKDGDISVKVIEDGYVKEVSKFRRWANIWSPNSEGKRHSVACCLPVSSNGEVQAWGQKFPLYSFFPTEENLPFSALLHASFDLDQSRKHVRDPNNENILIQIEFLIGRILDSIPAEIALKAFFPNDKPNKETLAHIIWVRIESVLRQKKFISCIGGKKVSPPNARLWDYDLGYVLNSKEEKVVEKSLVDPKLLKDSELRGALCSLGAAPLEDDQYLILLRYCRNENAGECQKSLGTLFIILTELVRSFIYKKPEHYLNLCRKVPCWWVADNHARSLSDKLPLLRHEPKISLPDWLRFDSLNHEILKFLEQIESKEDKAPLKIWNEVLSGKLLNNKEDELLHHFLVPSISAYEEADWWEQNGVDVLSLYMTWARGISYNNDPIAIWNDNDRKKLGNSLYLPTNKGWLPSWQCYAGVSWGGQGSFDRFFVDIEERGVIKEPDLWPVDIGENIDHWEKVLRYAGVSWEMKLVCEPVSVFKSWEIRGQSGSWWTECPFSLLINEKDWTEYLSSLEPPKYNKKTQFDWDTKILENWGIEYFPDALPDNPLNRLKAIKPIAKEAKDSRMRYSYQKMGGGWGGRNTAQLKSFAAWQIENFSWMPCKKSLLDNRLTVPPNKAYMPGKGIGGLLPEINIKIPDGQDGRDLATFLTQVLGVRETLPLADEMIWKEWIEKLPNAAQSTADHDIAIKATRMLYRSFFEIHADKPEWFEEITDIPCLRWDMEQKNEQLSFDISSKIYWLDESYLAEPNTRNELLQRFNIFVLEQQQGKKAAEWYEIKPLSTIVHVKPKFYTEDQDTTHIVQKRYAERFNSLRVASGLANIPKPENLRILAVDNLRLKIIQEELIISAPRVRFWKEEGLILLDRSRKWEALGLALAQRQARKGLSNLFENLLRSRDGNEVLQRLRDLGVPETAIDDLESDFQEAIAINTEKFKNQKTKEEEPQTEYIDVNGHQDVVKESVPEPRQSESGPRDFIESGKQKGGKTSFRKLSQSRRQKGEDAENWVRTAISDLLSISEWVVSSQTERDHLNRESDIVLFHPDFGKYHIEVKHVEAGELFWSEGEVSKAEDHKGKYWMVVVRPGYAEKEQNINWLWNPLEDLLNLPRRGRWFWRSETDDPEADISGWDVPSPRKKQDATHFTFIIKLNNEFLDNFRPDSSKGLLCLKEKLNLIK